MPISVFPPDPIEPVVQRTNPPAPVQRTRLSPLYWFPLVLISFLYLAASVAPALFNQNEAQYAGAAREMLNRPQDYITSARQQTERGQWLIPTNDGIPRLQKPPLVYWMLVTSMSVLGINDFSARLPNALASLAWFAGIVMLGVRMGPSRTAGLKLGLAAAMVLATMAGTFIFSHLVAPEPFLAAFLTWTFWALLSAYRDPGRADGFLNLAWLLMSLGAMTKGVHAILYPLAVVGLLAWRHPETRPTARRLFRPAGFFILAAVMVPWYAYVEQRYPGFLRDHWLNEQLGHVINRRYPPDNSTVAFPIFGLEHLIFFLPWTFFIPSAWQTNWRRNRSGGTNLSQDLLLAWFGVTLFSILFSSIQDYYLLTAFGPVAFWLARPWVVEAGPSDGLPRWMLALPGAALMSLGLLACGLTLFLRVRGVDVSEATNTYTERDQLWATVAGFSTGAWGQLLPLLGAAGIVLLSGGLAALVLAMRGNRLAVLASTAVMMLAVLGLAARGMSALEDYFSLKSASLLLNSVAPADGKVICYGPTSNSPSLLYYLNREVYWLGANADGEFASRVHGINRELFLDTAQFARWWSGSNPVFLCIESEDLTKLRARVPFTPAQLSPLGRFGTTLVLSNRQVRAQ